MNFSRGLSAILLLALPLTLSLRSWDPPSEGANTPLFATVAANFLTRHGYSVSVGKRGRTVIGRSGNCQIALMATTFDRSRDDALLILEGQKGFSGRDLFTYVYRGAVVQTPTTSQRLLDIWMRLRDRNTWYPLLAVRYAPDCDINGLDWGEVAGIAVPAQKTAPSGGGETGFSEPVHAPIVVS